MKGIQIEASDNVGVAIADLPRGATVVVEGVAGSGAHVSSASEPITITVSEPVGRGHKFALGDIPKGSAVVKYGVTIGRAKEDIKTGQFVHDHNVEDVTEELCRNYNALYRMRGGSR